MHSNGVDFCLKWWTRRKKSLKFVIASEAWQSRGGQVAAMHYFSALVGVVSNKIDTRAYEFSNNNRGGFPVCWSYPRKRKQVGCR